jgi:hypothetical protein
VSETGLRTALTVRPCGLSICTAVSSRPKAQICENKQTRGHFECSRGSGTTQKTRIAGPKCDVLEGRFCLDRCSTPYRRHGKYLFHYLVFFKCRKRSGGGVRFPRVPFSSVPIAALARIMSILFQANSHFVSLAAFRAAKHVIWAPALRPL